MENLAKKKCIPCEGGMPPMAENIIDKFLKQVAGWKIEEVGHKQIFKEFKFKNFGEAMKFVDSVATVAEREGHHPNIEIRYNRVRLTNYTHAIGGLHDNDFILAAKIDKMVSGG